MENTTHISDEDYNDLHHKLAQTVIDFFKEKGVPKKAWAIAFSFDDLKSSVDFGEWAPMSDSSLVVWDEQNNSLVCSM